MLLNIILLVASLGLLYFGAEWLVRGAARLATQLGVRPLVVGLVIVGFGTSMPELVVSSLASFNGHGQTALGNVIGSNIANCGLILAVAALIRPMKSDLNLLRREGPFMVLLTIVYWALSWTGVYGRVVGFASLGVLAIFVVLTLRWAGKEDRKVEAEFVDFEKAKTISGRGTLPTDIGLVLLGLVVLLGAGHLLVGAAVEIARYYHVSEIVIAITLISVGTSVPELATSIVAAVRKQADISVGNVIGSNIFNLLGVLGISSAIRPIEVDGRVRAVDMAWLAGFSVLTVVLLRRGHRLSRWEGAILMGAYIAFLVSAIRG